MEYVSVRVKKGTAEAIREEAKRRGVTIAALMEGIARGFEADGGDDEVEGVTEREREALKAAKRAAGRTSVTVSTYTSALIDVLVKRMGGLTKQKVLENAVLERFNRWYRG